MRSRSWQVWLRFSVNVLTLLSVGYFVYYIVRFDYVSLTTLRVNPLLMGASVALLCLAVIAGAMTWLLALRIHALKVPWHLALSSHGLSVFGKYVPGRVWTVLSRASQVAASGFPLADTSLLSLKAQLLNIWTGFAVGLVPSLFLAQYSAAGLVALGFVVATAPLLLSSRLQQTALSHVSRLVRRPLHMLHLPTHRTALLILSFTVLWLLYTFAFGLFTRALRPDALVRTAFAFPLAMNIGLLAIFVPGGVGVREGVMTGLLVAAGFDVRGAVTAALLSRLWFTAGEMFIFLLGALARLRRRVVAPSTAQRNSGEDD